MDLEIITPDKTIYKGDADLIQFPGIDGFFEILSNHAPLISVLKQGNIKVRIGKDVDYFSVKGGVVEVLKDKVLVLAE